MQIMTFDPPLGVGTEAKRLLRWLRDRLAARGVDAFGPYRDARGWGLTVYAEEGHLALRVTGWSPCAIRIDKLGEADLEYEDTLAACEDALAG